MNPYKKIHPMHRVWIEGYDAFMYPQSYSSNNPYEFKTADESDAWAEGFYAAKQEYENIWL